ncbi:bifunctional UDP-N-acetylmuramoyl-tripeptide:D-alanyl-D-alanine ligase/alanine racemase [Carboxylicivirga marina]|uniref:Alanine racemase n=1 Tax=Carboxylicivirga marina TaxID=2800988 RepID=A0ABS1HK56_9BACT|nr:bifunctional UDP-N-acetylmuramoyl-tripeptide:D-alanyl-D-alanine ligase/alanine racemase [Carboxylicivirga marina]MBK3518063.1 bifunctional UDP-N-acetylmuramoyl-tripeptide:D-alanyl-D-alanine ligase/alanine racemase [Carboxylicivirga marina]
MSYSLGQIAEWGGANLVGEAGISVEKIIFDSRKTFVAQKTLFIAVKSSNNDGHAYISELYDKGIRAFIVEASAHINYEQYPCAGFIECKDSVTCLQQIATKIRSNFSVPFIGITGSNGKTIVKEWLAGILESSYKLGRSPRSFNSQIGVPLSIWMLSEDIDYALIEAGISMPSEMEALGNCIQADYGIITNIGQAHQENFDSIDEKLQEKLKLFKSAHTIFYNGDDERISKAVTEKFHTKKCLSYGEVSSNNLCLQKIINTKSSATLELIWQSKPFKVSVPFQDAISIENALMVMLCSLNLGISIDQLQIEMPKLSGMAMRLEQKEGINNCLLVDDGYNADLTSLELALDYLNQMGAKNGLSKTLILSDIQQSGLNADGLYLRIQQLCRDKGINKLIGVGAHLYEAMGGANAFRTTDDLLQQIDINTFSNEAILIKGARQFAFERVSDLLEQRRHKTVLEINLNALAENVKYFRAKLQKETKLLAMVKAFSYGTGSFEIANLLAHQKVDYLGVAFADEGIELRKAGITLPIIVMNPELSSFPMMLEYELEPEIYSFEVLEAFLTAVKRQGLSKVSVHIKVDTGMNRLGFLVNELDELIQQLQSNSALELNSVFSHLAGSDDALHDGFTAQQITKFDEICNKLEAGLGHGFIRHILNSAGIERFPNAQLDMVRLGIGMYGVSAVETNSLQQVTTLKSYVSQLKTVKAGETVGYSRNGKARGAMQIAIIPIGYADGFNRRLSNGVGQVIINGHAATIVGNVCMDMCMADVTGIEVKAGDEVEVFGIQQTITHMAEQLDTIPYEILTSISRRVKRVYVME